jgi:putative SOS response-associated peptidase YedK
MCGRFLTPDQAALERHWGITAPVGFAQSFNLAPSQRAAAVRLDDDGKRDLSLLDWGFQPGWSNKAWINARSETVYVSKAFASAARKRRCLIPAMGWYEWQGRAAPRQPYVFHLDGFKPFAFAGIWTAREIDTGWVRSFAILTTAASGKLARIHHRKPVIVDSADYDVWLSEAVSATAAERVLDKDYAGIAAYKVSPYVNKPANNDAACIAPLDAA